MSNGDRLKPSHMGNGDRIIPDRMGNTYMLQLHKKTKHGDQSLDKHVQILHIISVSDNKFGTNKTRGGSVW